MLPAVIVALEVERRAFVRAAGDARQVTRSGPGAARAAAEAERVLGAGAGGLISWGLAAGLRADAVRARLLLPRCVVMADGRRYPVDEAWRARVAALLSGEPATPGQTILDAPILAVDEVLTTPAVKANAARQTGAAAADMESGAIAAAAFKARRPFIVVRAVADGPFDALPADIADWVDADGRVRFAPVAAASLRPWTWRTLVRLAACHRAARRVLAVAARRLAAEDFLAERA